MEENREETSNQAERINNLIKELLESNETIRKCKNAFHYWKINYSTLAVNIWAGEVKNVELMKREGKFRFAISETAKLIDFKEQEFKDLNMKRISRFSDQCDQIRIKGAKFAENFLRAQNEYSNENLTKNAAEFRNEFEAIFKELPIIGNKFAELETLCGFNNLSSLEESDEISTINILLADIAKTRGKETEKINEAMGTLDKLRGEIEEKRMALKSFEEK